ncbi:redoxin [Marinobacter lutaoensis]|uniref:Redoxin n=1 Tax=Marinobacter lutaoensis TaxID=135739 RepID=A0A1V2DPI6_9GAMM|nr:redoxin [Marinobacter lutaoensis]
MQYPVGTRARRVALALLLGGATAWLGGCQPPSFERIGGPPIEWDALRGQWVLVNYWAEWCQPCWEEIPALNALDSAPDITVLGVNFDGVTGSELSALGARMGIEFTLLAQDPGPALGWTSPVGLPATFVVAPDGSLREARFGAQTEAGIRALMRR